MDIFVKKEDWLSEKSPGWLDLLRAGSLPLFQEGVHVFAFVSTMVRQFSTGKISSKNAREGQLWWQHFEFQEGHQTRKWKCNLEHLEEKSATITLSGDFDGPYLPSNLN